MKLAMKKTGDKYYLWIGSYGGGKSYRLWWLAIIEEYIPAAIMVAFALFLFYLGYRMLAAGIENGLCCPLPLL